MVKGVVFDIKEFAVHDGPGVRLTIFFKGCPLRCVWCHNPEGLIHEPQINKTSGMTIGKLWSSEDLAAYISKFGELLEFSGGGVTFSGGEPLAQPDFLLELIELLPGVHKNLDTSGFCSPELFNRVANKCNLIFFDLKLGIYSTHIRYTGQSNEVIVDNLKQLAESVVPYHIRIPMIPGITDTVENLNSLLAVICSLNRKPKQIDLLPYNKLAGGKYASYELEYQFTGETKPLDEENIKTFVASLRRHAETKVRMMK